MSVRDAWSQDVVLKDMCEHIEAQHRGNTVADFIVLTGDLAYSGQAEEYALVEQFIDELCRSSGVPKDRVYCVAGNHDIDRDRQTLCFEGARSRLRSQGRVDAFLGGGEDMETLLRRQENYKGFQNSYFASQDRLLTEDGLGYVSWLIIENVRLAIVGFDSAWLAQGGMDDQGKLLIGERQIINALELVRDCSEPADVVIALAHHPLHWMQEFDRRSAMTRIGRTCQFLHYGHLHQPEIQEWGSGGSCLALSAGASYETRESHNCYSTITLDLLGATRKVETFQYEPAQSTFSSSYQKEFSVEVLQTDVCGISELADAMVTYDRMLEPWAFYLSALLLRRKEEYPVSVGDGHMLASFAVSQESEDGDLKRRTAEFMKFRNALYIFNRRSQLATVFDEHGRPVKEYAVALNNLCDSDASLRDRLQAQEADAKKLSNATPTTPLFYTSSLLDDLAKDEEWHLLCEQAQRHVDSTEPTVALKAKRYLAFSLAHSGDRVDKERAINLYKELVSMPSPDFSDVGDLAVLHLNSDDSEAAKSLVLQGIADFPDKAAYFEDIGHTIITATGDTDFRNQIRSATAKVSSNE